MSFIVHHIFGTQDKSRTPGVNMTYLEVPGASLYYESVGEGPLLLCISGADGSCEIWRGFQQCFEEQVQVVCYDRSSYLKGYSTHEPTLTYHQVEVSPVAT